jgi:hypothetical protein
MSKQKIKDQQSAELQKKVDAFLAAGGEIQVIHIHCRPCTYIAATGIKT